MLDKETTLKSVSVAIGKNHAYLQQFISRGVPRHLPEQVRDALARFFNVPPDEFRSGPPAADVTRGLSEGANHFVTFEPQPLAVDPRHLATKDLPVLGTTLRGTDGYFELTKQAAELAYRPAKLIGVPNAYSLYVPDDSMAPRYRQGELVYINPNRMPSVGEYAVVRLVEHDGIVRATLGEIVRRTSRKLLLQKYNPKAVIEIDVNDIDAVHWIVLAGAA